MLQKIFGSWIMQLFCIAWAAFLFLDYLNYSDYLSDSFRYFQYWDFIITYFVACAGVSYLLAGRKMKPRAEIKNFRGIYHYFFLIATMSLFMFFYLIKTGIVSGAAGYTVAFMFRSVLLHAGLAVIFVSALSTGYFITGLFGINLNGNTSPLVNLALGFAVQALILFLLGAVGLLYQFIVLPLIFILAIPGWSKMFSALKQALFSKSPTFTIHPLAILAYSFTLLLVALTLTYDTRTIPIGYDGLSLYMNIPKLISGYHSLTSGGDAYNWGLMMSLGFIMYNNLTISILISVVPGILCLFAIYKICRDLGVNRNWSIIACTLYYSLPNTIWQSKNEEKTDFALLFITLCSVLLFTSKPEAPVLKKVKARFQEFFSQHADECLWGLCGLLIGFSFGIKYVAMLSIFSFLVVLFYTNAGKFAAAFMFFLNLAVIFAADLVRFAAFENDEYRFTVLIPLVLSATAFFFTLSRNKTGFVTALRKAVIFLGATGIMFLPWAVKNISENRNITVENVLRGKSPLPELYPAGPEKTGNLNIPDPDKFKISLSGFSLLTIMQEVRPNDTVRRGNRVMEFMNLDSARKSAQIQQAAPAASNEKVEEIRRYLGYEKGFIKFISLPYDLVMKTNVKFGSSDPGIIILVLLPVLLFAYRMKSLPWNILKMLLLILFLAFSVASVLYSGKGDVSGQVNHLPFLADLHSLMQAMLLKVHAITRPLYDLLSVQSTGQNFILLLLFSIPLYFIFRTSAGQPGFLQKAVAAFVFTVIFYWLILSSGIIWYGIAGFSLLPVIFMLQADRTTDSGKFNRVFIAACMFIWLAMILPFQFMPARFVYTEEKDKIDYKQFLDPSFAKYAVGAFDDKEVMKQFYSPVQLDIIKALNSDKRSKVINVGTFTNFFIVNNDARVYKDNQVGVFSLILDHAGRDKSRLAGELKSRNIRYIVINLKTPELDKTPEQSLKKKFDNMMRSLVNNPQIRLVATNRLVERPDGDMDITTGGVQVKARYDIVGRRVIDPGTDALFEVL